MWWSDQPVRVVTMRWPTVILLGASLTLFGCGSDGDEAGGDLSEDQQDVVDELSSAMEESGLDLSLDRSCAEDATRDLSDEDAATIAASEGDTEGVSAEGLAVVDSLLNCVDVSSLIDEMITEAEGYEMFDTQCLRDAYESAEPSQVLQSIDDFEAIDLESCLLE